MKTDVALILLPSWGHTDIPLTLSTLSSHLRSQGFSVRVFDFNVELYHLLPGWQSCWDLARGLDAWETDSFVRGFWEKNRRLMESLVRDIVECGPAFAGFSVFNSNRLLTEIFAQALKTAAPGIKTVFGGPQMAHIQDLPGYAAEHAEADHIVVGEGEAVLTGMLRGSETGRILSGLGTIRDLDALPLQDFSDFDFELYKDVFAFPTYSSRGCPNACIYCTERNFAGVFRTRSAERLFEEIKAQKQRHPQLKMFRLHESTSNGNIRQLEEFCELMMEAELGLNWAMNGAVMRKEMDARLCTKLRRAGCVFINYGLETPSAKVLENVGKRLAKGTDFGKVVRDTHGAGIEVAVNIMFGLPGETEEDFQLQMDFLRKNHPFISIIAPSLWFCYFPRNSEGFQKPDKYGIDLEYGSLYWKSLDGENTYPVRMDRFIRYTNLMEELGVTCVFGYPPLPHRDELLQVYYAELAGRGRVGKDEIPGLMREVSAALDSPARRKNVLRELLRRFIYKIAPAAIHNAINEKARARLLEQRLNKLLAQQERGPR